MMKGRDVMGKRAGRGKIETDALGEILSFLIKTAGLHDTYIATNIRNGSIFCEKRTKN